MTARDMDDAVGPRPPSRRGWRRAAAIAGVIVLLVLAAAWLARRPIASRFVDRALAARGVPATYRIEDLGFGRQRLSDVVIGDPVHPDLVADWVELRTAYSTAGVRVAGIRAGRVRMHGRLVDGRLSLGVIDRLLPAPSGRPFALPAIDLRIADGRMRLATPQGLVGLKLSGSGRLDDGFSGRLAAVSDRLSLGGCEAEHPFAVMAIRIRQAQPSVTGPARIAALTCGTTRLTDARADLTAAFTAALDRARGTVRLTLAQVELPGMAARDLSGSLAFDGSASDLAGTADLASGRFATGDVAGAGAGLTGRYRFGSRGLAYTGRVTGRALSAAPARIASLTRLLAGTAGTPVEPVAHSIAAALAAAASRFDGAGDVALRGGSGGYAAQVGNLDIRAASGARLALGGGVALSSGAWTMNGTLRSAGGGLPTIVANLHKPTPGAAITGTATMQPYLAGAAGLALAYLRFSAAPSGETRVTTGLAMSGPFGSGRIDGLRLPVELLWDGGRRVVVNPRCTPVAFERLQLSSLVLGGTGTALCPMAGGLFVADGGRIGGGARTGALSLAGRLGSSPVTLAAADLTVDLAAGQARLHRLATRIGVAPRQTRLDFATLDAGWSRAGFAGRFAGGLGRIGTVPLLLSNAAAPWRYRDAALTLVGGALQVDDADAAPRFTAMVSRDVSLRLANNVITADVGLANLAKGVAIGRAHIVHDLGTGRGAADIAVPAIVFDERFTPDDLTRLTFGVIADVKGSVSGAGVIRWSPGGVTSSGTFRTAGTDLAAAFGPVTGISTEIRFTDLLALQSAPGQIATVASINPGVPVTNGTVRYQMLPDARIRVEQGRWPFAGGTLTLEPTLLDFGEGSQARRMTFAVAGIDAAQFIQQFGFSNLNATGTFDGTLPMVFDATGGRIEGGRLAVRTGGGGVAYVGEVTQHDVGFWGNFVFQALKSLRYRDLSIAMNGPLSGELVTEVRFAGLSQGTGARRNFLLDRLQRLPFTLNLRISAPFRQLIDSAQSFYDPSRLVQRNLQALLAEQNRRAAGTAPPLPAPSIAAPSVAAPTRNPVQPPASEHQP